MWAIVSQTCNDQIPEAITMTKMFLTKLMRHSTLLAAVLSIGFFAVPSQATLAGTVPTFPGDSVSPGITFDPAGTLLADVVDPWTFTTTAGTTSGTLEAAVYMEAGGTLDFYYQVANDSTSATAIRAVSNTSFTGFLTDLGFRIDGSTLTGTSFVDGTVAPLIGDRDASGAVVGFNFSPPNSAKILAGTTSNVLVISTDATKYEPGNSELLDGGSITVTTFQPAANPIPEPMSFMLLGTGLLGLGLLRRKTRKA
jgi:hypothetical protein